MVGPLEALDQESARAYFEARRWPDEAVCPACGERERIGTRKGGYYRCNACLLDFTVRTGTIFERSKVPLHKWLYAMYLLVTARKGISSIQLAKQIGVTQKSAWFMLQRLREACGNDPTELAGIVEMDEAYIGGREDAVTDRVLAYRPAGRGQQAKKVARRVERQRKAGDQDDRESSI
jgi:transposase-like protein